MRNSRLSSLNNVGCPDIFIPRQYSHSDINCKERRSRFMPGKGFDKSYIIEKCDTLIWPKYICPFMKLQIVSVTQFYLFRAKATSHIKGFVPGDPLRECCVILCLEVFHHRH